MNNLHAKLLAAHEENDHQTLVALYQKAAQCAATEDEAGFFLTHAYVFALEQGHCDAPALKARLVEMGRDTAR